MKWMNSRYLLFSVLLTSVFLQSCTQKSNAQPDLSWKQALKDSTVGDWQEIHTLNEMLHFDADGSLLMSSPAEHRTCTSRFSGFQPHRSGLQVSAGNALCSDLGVLGHG